jgi:uncharacterized protein with HEPN domain
MSRLMKQRLHEILSSCQAIISYTDKATFEDYLQNDMMRDAVERRLGIIGEALTRAERLDPAIGSRIPDIRPIVGMRNRLIHGYEAIDDELIWRTLQTDLPRLQAQVAALIDGD